MALKPCGRRFRRVADSNRLEDGHSREAVDRQGRRFSSRRLQFTVAHGLQEGLARALSYRTASKAVNSVAR